MTAMTIAPAAASTPPGCPPWCDRCAGEGDFVIHMTDAESIKVTPELVAVESASVEVDMYRSDDETGRGQTLIRIDVSKAGTLTGDHAEMTSEQVRALAASLVRRANWADAADFEAGLRPLVTLPDELQGLLTGSDGAKVEVVGWCPRCRCERPITGRWLVSASGVGRIRGGRCHECGKGGINVLASRAVPR